MVNNCSSIYFTVQIKRKMEKINREMKILVLLTLWFGTDAMPANGIDLCAGCTMVNGAGFNKHPTDCNKFVQCHFDRSGKLVGEIQQCAFGTEWHMDLLTCVLATETTCVTDTCRGLADGTLRQGAGNCRGFWECVNGRSVARCCPVGQYYNETYGCEDNIVADYCVDRCFNEIYVPSLQETTTLKPCFKRAVVNMRSYYEEEIAGWGWLLRQCAIGTVYDPSTCECQRAPDVQSVTPPACEPELFLPFTNDHFDHSGKGNFVKNENVVIENGAAHFNGRDSRLIIPRFTNLESNNVVINVKYTSEHGDLLSSQAVVSNNDCGIDPAIKITEDSKSVTFTVGTNNGVHFQTDVSVPQPTTPQLLQSSEKDITYRFVNGILSGRVNSGEEVTKSVPGQLRKVHCALHIGHAEDAMPFKGQIDEITVYLCNPSK